MSYIALLDPALMNHQGQLSTNLGDLIIYESVSKILTALFPKMEIVRIASHVALDVKQQKMVNEAEFAFVGGTNIFLSDYNTFRLLKLKDSSFLLWLNPGIKNLIFLGVGWGNGYGDPITWKTKIFYDKILHKDYIQSARDNYSAQKISPIRHCLNTSCPTLWELNGFETNRTKGNQTECLFTLTDYSKNVVHDTTLIQICLDHFDKLSFFPQGLLDKNYIESLAIYQKNKEKITILPHNIAAYNEYVSQNEDFVFVGTRLHGGIKCMQAGKSTLIIGVDNRALEISKDIGLSVVMRNDYNGIRAWLRGEKLFGKLHIPEDNIQTWKKQFQ